MSGKNLNVVPTTTNEYKLNIDMIREDKTQKSIIGCL